MKQLRLTFLRAALLGISVLFFGHANLAMADIEAAVTDDYGTSEELMLEDQEEFNADFRTKPSKDVMAKSISKAYTQLGNAMAIASASADSQKGRATAKALAKAMTKCGDALAVASAGAFTGSKKAAVSSALSTAVTFAGQAQAISSSISESQGGVAVATSVSVAVSFLGDAIAISSAVATSN